MAQTYRVGLVGCGRMGTTIDDEVRDRPNARLFLPYSHAAAVVACERTELVAVCDPVADKAETARQRYGAHSAYEDPEVMIRKEGLDVVCIATRPSPHAPVTLLAAENGVRAIYCEKPLCNSMAEADAMAAAVVAHGVKFNYGTQRRYVRMYRNLREMIDAGHIGQLQSVIAHCGASAAQWGHTHAADMLLFLAGDGPVSWVQGTARFEDTDWERDRLTVDPPIETGTIRFADGVTGSFVPAGGYEFEVSGTEGKLRTLSNAARCSWRRLTACAATPGGGWESTVTSRNRAGRRCRSRAARCAPSRILSEPWTRTRRPWAGSRSPVAARRSSWVLWRRTASAERGCRCRCWSERCRSVPTHTDTYA